MSGDTSMFCLRRLCFCGCLLPIFEKRREVLFWVPYPPSPFWVAISADVLPYISVAIKASFLKLGMCNICKNNIAKMFLDFLFKFKIVHLIEVFLIFGKKSSACGISKKAGWIFTKFALQVLLSLSLN